MSFVCFANLLLFQILPQICELFASKWVPFESLPCPVDYVKVTEMKKWQTKNGDNGQDWKTCGKRQILVKIGPAQLFIEIVLQNILKMAYWV